MIEHYSFGKIVINKTQYTSDILIVNDTVYDWWRKQGHVLHPSDLDKVFSFSPHTLVVGTGAHGMMKVPENTRTQIEGKGITVLIHRTEKAVKVFNQLKAKKAAALHLTC